MKSIPLLLLILACSVATASIATAGEVVPAVNGIRDDDGVIRFRPPYCGPEGFVIHDPKYGDLCAQKGTWATAAKGKVGTPCVHGKEDVGVGENGELLTCQAKKWRVAGEQSPQIGDACDDIEITVAQGGTVLLCDKGKYRVAPEKAAVASPMMLPATGNTKGDVRKVLTTKRRFVWTGEQWAGTN